MASVYFNEGKDHLLTNDVEGATWYTLVSTNAVPADVNDPQAGEHSPADTLSGDGVAEATAGDWGGREDFTVAAPSDGVILTGPFNWATGEFTDGPSAAKSLVIVTSADDSGVAICAVDIGGTRNLSRANAELDVTEIAVFLANPDETGP